jgi:hypothetical protein
MFRVQNLCVLRYDKEFVMNKNWHEGSSSCPMINNNY